MEPQVLTNGYRLRAATREDAPHIIRLIKALAEYEKEADKVHHLSRSRRYHASSHALEALLTAEQLAADGFGDHPLFFCILAESDETPRKVVGFSLYFYVYSTWAGRAMHLEDLFIDLPYRKKGMLLMTYTRQPFTTRALTHTDQGPNIL